MASVAIITNSAKSIVQFRRALIQELIRAGHEVIALAPDLTSEVRVAAEQLGAIPVEYPLRRTSLSPLSDMKSIFALRSLLRQHKVDVVLSCAVKPAIYGTLAARLSGIRQTYALIEGLGYAFTEGSGQGKRALIRMVMKPLFAVALRCTKKTLFLNGDDLTEFVSLGLVPPSKAVKVGGIGVDLKNWQSKSATTLPPTFLFVGRLLRDKGIFEFVDAARRVKSRIPEARFVVLGDLDANPSAVRHEQVEEWMRDGVIDWHGHTDVRPWLETATAFVLPSYREGLPVSTQEAMAMSRAVITTDVPGCRDTVVQGKNGFIVPPRDASALATAIIRFCEDPSLAGRMGRESRAMAVGLFDEAKASLKLMAAIGLTSSSVEPTEYHGAPAAAGRPE